MVFLSGRVRLREIPQRSNRRISDGDLKISSKGTTVARAASRSADRRPKKVKPPSWNNFRREPPDSLTGYLP